MAAWWPDRLELADAKYWNATAFTGATLRASQLIEAANPVEAAVDFFTEGRDRLAAAVNGS